MIEFENVACPLGCARDDRVVITAPDRLNSFPGEFTVVKCGYCGLMRTNPRPILKDMLSYYPDDYGPYQGTRIVERRVVRQRRGSLFLWLKSILAPQEAAHTIPQMPIGRMLEIGCGSGRFLHLMAGEGWAVEGIEPGGKAAEAAREHGYQVHVGPLETAPEPKQKYNLVAAWMVLEHLHQPIQSLEKLYRWTEEGAWLAFSVPDAGSWEFKVFRDRWFALQVPTHCYHYTPKTIRRVLKAGGWQLEQIFWQGSATNLLKSLRYLADDYHWKRISRFLSDLLERRRWKYPLVILRRVVQLAHASGRMTVWARRMDG